jgi:subtilisin family serine protease
MSQPATPKKASSKTSQKSARVAATPKASAKRALTSKKSKKTRTKKSANKSAVKSPVTAKKAAVAKPARIAHLKPHEHSVERQQFSPGLLMVKCKEDVVANVPDIQAAHIASVRGLSLPKAVESPFEKLLKENVLREVMPVFSRLTRGRSLSIAPTSVAASFATSVRDSENEDLRGINMLRLSRSADLKKIEKELAATPGIEYVHRLPRRWISIKKPNDPFVTKQWGLNAIRWLKLDALPNASTVKVGVLDTGVDLTHPELMNVVNSYVHEGASSIDIVGHGTHVSGIIAAEMNNKIGITGISQCDLTVWKIFTDQPDPEDGEFYVDDIMYQRALNAARNAGMRVVNLSIGGTDHNRTEELLFRRLINAGCTVVAAMGNEFNEGNPTEYPAAYGGTIAVGATTKSKGRASFSNTGKHISIAAPGYNILSTLPLLPSAEREKDETKYAIWSGTSMATPHVTAAAALVIASDPNLSPQQVAEKLKSTATKLPAMGGKSFTREFGYGLLNVQAAVS